MVLVVFTFFIFSVAGFEYNLSCSFGSSKGMFVFILTYQNISPLLLVTRIILCRACDSASVKFLFMCLQVCVCVLRSLGETACHSLHVKARGYPSGISSLFPLWDSKVEFRPAGLHSHHAELARWHRERQHC